MDVLATCRFALLVKVYSETGKSSVETLAGDTLFELFGTVFLFIWCGNSVLTPLFLALHSWSGVNISHSTVSRRLNLRFGLKSCKLVQKPPLNPLLMKKRLSHVKVLRNWTSEDWCKVLFYD